MAKLSLGVVVLVSACGRSELSGWLLAEAEPQGTESVGAATSIGVQAATGGPALTAATTAGGGAVTGAGGMSASASDVTTGAGASTSAGGMTASAGGSLGMGGEGGEAPSEIELEPDVLVPGRYKLEYSASFSASGGSGSYEFRVTAGELPPGLSLASDGALTGTPTFPGTWSFVVEVTDELGARAEQEYTLEIERNSLVALSVFLSSSSTRADALLIDLTQPGDVLHRQEYSGYPKFSPDGRWLKWSTFDDQGSSDRYAQPLVDRTPLQQVPLAEDETDRPWCVWSPDSKRLGCALASSEHASFELGVRSVTNTSIEEVVPVADATAGDPQWLSPTRLAYTDADTELFVANVGSDVVTVEPYLQSLRDEAAQLRLVTDYGYERAVVYSVDGSPRRTFVVDLATETWHDLSVAADWMFAPELDMMLGWEGGLDFAHAMIGTELLGPLDTSGAGAVSVDAATQIALAPNTPRFVAMRDGRAIVSSVVAGALENVEVTGPYGLPQTLGFSPDGRWLTLATDTELWLTDLSSTGPFAAVKLSDVKQAGVVFAPDSSALAFVSAGVSSPTGGPPVTFGVVDLTQPPEFATRLLETDDEWGWPTWSNDASYLVFLGGSITEGRALHLYDLLEPDSPRRLIVSCDVPIGASPGCPNGATFQPWVSWASLTPLF